MEKNLTKAVATGGVLLALSVATLFGATFVPGIELTLYALSSLYVAIIMIEISNSSGWLFYFASVLLSFLIVPNKGGVIPYAFYFGLFAIIKYYIENSKKFSQAIEIVLKLLFSNLMFIAAFLFFGELFTGAINIPDIAFPIIIIGAQVFFLAYDYIFTIVIAFYVKRRPKV